MTQNLIQLEPDVRGEICEIDNEQFYKIHNVDRMPTFFISLISDQDHWLFAASNGGLTMGRVSPETAVFPYVTVDKLYESTLHTGPRTLIRVEQEKGNSKLWHPFNTERDGDYAITRNLYKNVLGNALCYEEINHELNLCFRYTWRFSDKYGLARCASLQNMGSDACKAEILDGVQNVLPAGTPRFTQTQSSNLVDAYKWTELDTNNKLALYTLYSAITDRAEPVEALKATTVFVLGLPHSTISLSSECIHAFKLNKKIPQQTSSRGVRGAYFVNAKIELNESEQKQWTLVVDVEQNQTAVTALQNALTQPDNVASQLKTSFAKGDDNLAKIMAAADGFQATGEPEVALHHYANTQFNVLRGGIFADQYNISKKDIVKTIKHFNAHVYTQHKEALNALPDTFNLVELEVFANKTNDAQLERLLSEYLPITFGRRHGDPSRPWNQFAIELKDELGAPLLSYQGNWRDIFQNWEALSLSYPGFIEAVIAKFVNASTVDGYNPYRITKQGIDWEVEEPDDPWSYIGYWGDHQIIYLLKLLEWSDKFHPGNLTALLSHPIYCYANVPYRIKAYKDLVKNPKDTVEYDEVMAQLIEQRTAHIGADGKLILNANNEVYQVNLLEKLVVPLLSKISNLVIDGGIWLNTQRPEWNDANNALVGQGLSMVTLYYLNRYVDFLTALLAKVPHNTNIMLTREVHDWLTSSIRILQEASERLHEGQASPELQRGTLEKLGELACNYRNRMYQHQGDFTTRACSTSELQTLCNTAKKLFIHSIQHNVDDTGLYHAYNTLSISPTSLKVNHLYSMLEGQVAALSSGALTPEQALSVLENLFNSDMYRQDQRTFMLYPDRQQTPFLSKNILPANKVEELALIKHMLAIKDTRIVTQDSAGQLRFNAEIINAGALKNKWNAVAQDFAEYANENTLEVLLEVFEEVFNHNAFTGRSGGMFGFEGLGCIYWHMVSKLLLAAQECAIHSVKSYGMNATSTRLIHFYYRIREGIGFNKTPSEYGAFPADPYSHTPKHAGAQQPGMTGQVKEELLTRFNELGCFVEDGKITFSPFLLRKQEFTQSATTFRYLDVANNWQEIMLQAASLGFTWCQVPIIFSLSAEDSTGATITLDTLSNGTLHINTNTLDAQHSQAVFKRTGDIKRINVSIPADSLYAAAG